MKRLRVGPVAASVFLVLLLMFPSNGSTEGLTKEQGDQILNELKQIRVLLEKQQKAAPAGVPSEPRQERVTLKTGNDFVLGRKDAPVTLVEYTDYQCSFCNRFHAATFPELKRRYIDTGQVRFIKRDLPLPFHQNALKAAQAARCAGEQGKFWEMHDRLSANPATLGPETYSRFAQDLSLSLVQFEACVGSEKYLSQINDQAETAAAVGITGTPSFVIGVVKGDAIEGVKIVGAQPLAVYEKAIKEALPPRTSGEPAK